MDTIGEQQLKQAKLLVAFIVILVLLAVGGLYTELFYVIIIWKEMPVVW